MKKTTNYQLSQWDPDDKVLRTDFNADNAKIDAAIRANANAISSETSARNSAVMAVSATIPKIAIGTYTGNGAASRTVSVGFTPRAVLVTTAEGWMRYNYSSSSHYTYGGLALSGAPAVDSLGQTFVSIRSGGFQVVNASAQDSYHDNHYSFGNENGTVYHYIAIS